MESERLMVKRCRSRSVEELLSSLPEEVVQGEILRWLPGRSLARFKSVNKTWHSLISSPSFRRLCNVEPEWSLQKLGSHLSDLESKAIELLVPPWKGLSSAFQGQIWKTHPPQGGEDHVVLQPDENFVVSALGPNADSGFYCLAASVKKHRLIRLQSGNHYDPAEAHYYLLLSGRLALFNPSTGATKLTNPFPHEIRDPLFSKVVPWNTSSVHLGFGESKIVVLIQYGEAEASSSIESLVYSFVDQNWTTTLPPTAPAGSSIKKIFDSKQSLMKGKWHWMALLNNNTNNNNSSYGILSFDLGSHEYKLMGGPSAYVDHFDPNDYLVTDEEAEVCVLQERLTVIHMARVLDIRTLGIYMAKVDVFMMMEYGVRDSWVKLYTLEPNPPRTCCDTAISLVGIDYRSGDNSFRGLYFGTQFKSCIFRLDDNGYKVVRSMDRAKHSCWNFYAQHI